MTHKNEIEVSVGAGRFDAKNEAVTARCERAMRITDAYLSTEVMHNQRKAFRSPGCKRIFISEYGMLYNPEIWKPFGKTRLNWLTRIAVTFSRGHIRIRARQMTVRLRHLPTGKRGYFDIAHLPAHIQDRDDFTNEDDHLDEVVAHIRATNSAGKRVDLRRIKHPDRFQVWSGDVNLDQFREQWRKYMSSNLHLNPVWRSGGLPAIGDMADRLITGAWTYGVDETVGTILRNPDDELGLDHRLMIFSGRLRP